MELFARFFQKPVGYMPKALINAALASKLSENKNRYIYVPFTAIFIVSNILEVLIELSVNG